MTKKHSVKRTPKRKVVRRRASPSPMKSTTKMVQDTIGFSATALTGMAGIGVIKAMQP